MGSSQQHIVLRNLKYNFAISLFLFKEILNKNKDMAKLRFFVNDFFITTVIMKQTRLMRFTLNKILCFHMKNKMLCFHMKKIIKVV